MASRRSVVLWLLCSHLGSFCYITILKLLHFFICSQDCGKVERHCIVKHFFFSFADYKAYGITVKTDNSHVKAREFEEAFLSCKYSTKKESDARIEWKKITGAGVSFIYFRRSFEGSFKDRAELIHASIQIKNVTRKDSGKYRCEISAPTENGQEAGEVEISLLVQVHKILLVGGLGFREGELNLVLNGVALPLKDKVRSLEVLLDPELSLEAQVTAVARSAFLQLRLIHQLRPYLEYDCLATVTHALVTSRLDFCNTLYVGLPLKTVRILQLVQNRAARLLTGTGRYVHMTPVPRQLHWLPIEVRAQFKVLVMTYKALNGLGPGYLKERLHPYMPSRPLRSAGEALLREPSVVTRRRAFSA
ncbi:Junctional adhesion molecule B, partial [Varanus komodoensis]